MRKPSRDYKIQADSISEIKQGIDHGVISHLTDRGVKVRNRKIEGGPLLNVIVLHFLLLPEKTQDEIVAFGIDRYHELLACDEPQKLADIKKSPVKLPPGYQGIQGTRTRMAKGSSGDGDGQSVGKTESQKQGATGHRGPKRTR